jgi:nicotinamidase-related amidase
MSQPIYRTESTALLLVDPYNDFLSEGGKIWSRIKPIAEEIGLIANLKAIDVAARNAGMRVFIAPHRRWEPGDYEDWSHPNPTQTGSKRQLFLAL